MTVWDLSRIRYTIRKITGKFDQTQLPDVSPAAGLVTVNNPSGIDDYINDFYMYDLPEHMRTLKLRNFFTFPCIPNVGTYNIPQNIYQLDPPVYVDSYQGSWHQSPDTFYRLWPELDFINSSIAQGDGVTSIFSFTLTQTTIQQGSVVVGLRPNIDGNPSPQLETFIDTDTPALLDQPTQLKFTNPGILLSNLYTGAVPPLLPGVTPGTGTVDYLTGAITISYINAPPAGTNINVHYHPYEASRPRDILFYQQQLFLRPIPRDTYLMKMMAYFMPTAAISAATNATQRALLTSTGNLQGAFDGSTNSLSDVPLFNEWWQLICYGASIKILIEDGDYEEVNNIKPIFEEQKLLAQRKALKQLACQRIQTIYSENNTGGPSWPNFPMY